MTTVAKVKADASQFNRELSAMGNRVDRFSSRAVQGFGSIASAVSDLGKAFIALNTTIVASSATAIDAAAEMDYQIRQVATLLPGVASTAYEDLERRTRDFAVNFGTTTQEIARGWYQAFSAGAGTIERAQSAVQQGIKAAWSTGADTESAVQFLQQTSNAFDISAREAGDIVFELVRVGVTELPLLITHLSKVAPIAKDLEISFVDTAAALATLTRYGVPTAQATTQLARLYLEAGDTSKELGKIIKDTFGSTYRELILQGHDAVQIISDLRDVLGEEKFIEAFGEINAYQGGSKLVDFLDRYHAIKIDFTDHEGALDTAYSRVEDSMEIRLERLRNAWAETQFAFADSAEDSIAGVVDQMTESLVSFTANPVFAEFADGIGRHIEALADFGQEAMPVFVNALNSSLPIFQAFSDIFLTAGSQLALALQEGMPAFVRVTENMTDVMANFGEGFGEIIAALSESSESWEDMVTPISELARAFAELAPAIAGLTNVMADVFGFVGRGASAVESVTGIPGTGLLGLWGAQRMVRSGLRSRRNQRQILLDSGAHAALVANPKLKDVDRIPYATRMAALGLAPRRADLRADKLYRAQQRMEERLQRRMTGRHANWYSGRGSMVDPYGLFLATGRMNQAQRADRQAARRGFGRRGGGGGGRGLSFPSGLLMPGVTSIDGRKMPSNIRVTDSSRFGSVKGKSSLLAGNVFKGSKSLLGGLAGGLLGGPWGLGIAGLSLGLPLLLGAFRGRPSRAERLKRVEEQLGLGFDFDTDFLARENVGESYFQQFAGGLAGGDLQGLGETVSRGVEDGAIRHLRNSKALAKAMLDGFADGGQTALSTEALIRDIEREVNREGFKIDVETELRVALNLAAEEAQFPTDFFNPTEFRQLFANSFDAAADATNPTAGQIQIISAIGQELEAELDASTTVWQNRFEELAQLANPDTFSRYLSLGESSPVFEGIFSKVRSRLLSHTEKDYWNNFFENTITAEWGPTARGTHTNFLEGRLRKDVRESKDVYDFFNRVSGYVDEEDRGSLVQDLIDLDSYGSYRRHLHSDRFASSGEHWLSYLFPGLSTGGNRPDVSGYPDYVQRILGVYDVAEARRAGNLTPELVESKNVRRDLRFWDLFRSAEYVVRPDSDYAGLPDSEWDQTALDALTGNNPSGWHSWLTSLLNVPTSAGADALRSSLLARDNVLASDPSLYDDRIDTNTEALFALIGKLEELGVITAKGLETIGQNTEEIADNTTAAGKAYRLYEGSVEYAGFSDASSANIPIG